MKWTTGCDTESVLLYEVVDGIQYGVLRSPVVVHPSSPPLSSEEAAAFAEQWSDSTFLGELSVTNKPPTAEVNGQSVVHPLENSVGILFSEKRDFSVAVGRRQPDGRFVIQVCALHEWPGWLRGKKGIMNCCPVIPLFKTRLGHLRTLKDSFLQTLDPAVNLHPTDSFDDFRATTGTFYKIVQELGIGVRQIVIGGSCGKGTMLRGQSDLDLVVLVNGFNATNYKELYLDKLYNKVKAMCYTTAEQSVHAVRLYACTVTGTASGMTTFRLSKEKPKREVLVDVDVLFGEYFESQQAFVDKLNTLTTVHANNFSASASFHLVPIIKELPDQWKTLVRILKYWRDQFKWTKKPKSYFLELVALHVFQRYQGDVTTQKLVESSLDLLRCASQLNIVPTAQYRRVVTNLEVIITPDESIASQRPLVLDILNKFQNVADGLDAHLLSFYASLTLHLIS